MFLSPKGISRTVWDVLEVYDNDVFQWPFLFFGLLELLSENKYQKKDHQNINELRMSLKQVNCIMVKALPWKNEILEPSLIWEGDFTVLISATNLESQGHG